MGGDSLFIPFVALPDYYLRFTKINGIYRLKSVVIKNDDHTAPKIEEIKDAEENYREYYSNPYKNSYEWNVESIFEVKSRIYKIKKKEYLAENEKEEIKKLEDKIMVLEYLKNTMQKYVNLVELINIFGRLQRLYEKSGEIIELIYPDYSGEAKEQIIISSGIPESIENIDINPLYANINEYTFQPFINAESGNLDPAVLREDYKASLIKSMIYHYIAYHRSFGQKDSNYNDIKADKYDRQYNFNYVFDFVQKRVGSIFLEMMETGFDNILNWELSQLKFNHYQYILDRLDEEEIKKYYEFDPEESSHFTSATIIINPDSAKQIEYKYNPVDDIVGGELVIQARNYIEDDETEETAQEEASQKLSPGQLISALSSIPVFAGQRESIFDLIPEEYRERYNFLKEKARIYDKGQELLKTAEEDIAGSEEIKEEELKVGRERIYTGANRRQSSEAEKRLIRKIFNIAEGQKIEETVKSLGGEISREKEYSAEVYRDEKEEDIVINYSPVDHEDRATLLSLAAGLPNEQFDRAERTYREEVRENGTGYKYTLTGVSLGASFAQYAALMSEGFVNNYQAIGYNSIGLEQCLRFNGNEFLGYQIGIYHYLKKLLDGDNTMETILADLIDEGVIVYDNISPQYRKGEKINEEKLKAVLVDIFTRRLGLEEERAKEIIEKNFNPLIVQRKMRLMDRHREYRNWLKREKEKDRIVNYLYSGNLPALLLAQAGSSYLVDRGLQKLEDEGRKEIIREKAKLAEGLPERDFRIAKAGDLDLFLPYLYIKEEGISQKRLKNRTGEKPQTGNICNCLSLDYLKALVRDVVHDLKGKDPEALKKLFWFHRAQSPAAML
ncbi:MAG: hypothetical protein GX175_05790, partial [Halanaerobiaceae bacterium]|nr:hypothetical protein [Halanaerobiaceae bacterium]